MDRGSKPYRVVVNEEAEEMLAAQVRYLSKVNKSAARQLIVAFDEAADNLQYFPERCPWATDPVLPAYTFRKLIILKRYVMLFQIMGDTVYVETFSHERQDYAWKMH
jgi:plasmid stabilization system protein ParE